LYVYHEKSSFNVKKLQIENIFSIVTSFITKVNGAPANLRKKYRMFFGRMYGEDEKAE